MATFWISQSHQPYNDIKPYLYHADFFALDTSDCIRNQTQKILIELFKQGIKIRTITGDNFPSQLYTLCNWSESSLLKTTQNPDVKKIERWYKKHHDTWTVGYQSMLHYLELIEWETRNVYYNMLYPKMYLKI